MLAGMRILTLLLLGPLALFAQTTASTLTGVITDPSGGAVAGARVSAINELSGVALPTQSNAAGVYRIGGLSPGAFRVEVEGAGFQKLVRRGIIVEISQTLQLDLTLQVGSIQETVSVTAAASLLETQTATVGQLVERQLINGMPMANRNSTALLALIPAATIQNVSGDIPIFSVAGGRMRNQQFTLDGGNHTNTVGLAVNQSQVPLPMDAMQEFRVLSNNYSAEYGQSQSGIVTLATRSGSNQVHGSLFEYARNEALDARNFFAASRPKFRQHQFGATVGGPVRKDRTHYFVSYERSYQVSGGTSIQTVPSSLQRQGDFSETRDAQSRVIPIFDPSTTPRQPFAANRLPASRIDPVAARIAGFWPDPNRTAAVTGANNFALNTRPQVIADTGIVRLDHQVNYANQVMVRYFINDRRTINPGVYPQPDADASVSLVLQRVQNLLGTWLHTFRPDLVNEFRLGFVRRGFHSQRPGLGKDLAGQLGLRSVSNAAFPIIGITGITGLSGAPFRFSSPLLDYQIQEALSWSRGTHAIKLGFETRLGVFNDDTDTSSSGSFSFIPQITGMPGSAATGIAFASFLLGEVNAANTIRPDPIVSRASYWGVYLQDDWRLSNSLTVNLGLRWEATMPRRVDQDRMNAFDTTAGNPVSGTPGVITFAGRNGVPRSAYDLDANNFGPRVGFAWKLFSRTVVRAGGGLIYGASVNSIVGTSATLGFSTDFRITATEVGITSAMRLRDGFPNFTRPTIEQLGSGFGAVPVGRAPTTAVTFFERRHPTPYSWQYNLEVQQQVPGNGLVEIAYLANLSHKLTAPDLSINQVPPDRLAAGNAQVRRPFPQFTNVSVLNPPLGNSSYHAGFVKFERRFSQGLALLGHYTFSKFIDDVESFSEFGDAGSYMDFYNRHLDKGLSGSHVRHRAVVSGVFEIPFPRQRPWLAAVFGGWKTGVIASFQTGPVFSVFSFINSTNAFPAGALRADLVGNPRLADSERSLSRWFNTAAFAVPAPFRFGTAGRSILTGPGISTVDASLIKAIPIAEGRRAEIRAEFFNLPNHTNFNLPAHSAGAPAFGIIASARPARSTQLALRIEF